MPALPKPATFGACLHPFSAGSFLLAETVHPPGCKLAQHSHARANLVVVLEGQFIETRGGRSFECGAHSGLFKTPGELHSSVYGTKGARCLLIEIDDRRSSALAADPGVLERVAVARSPRFSLLALRAYRELRFPDNASALAIEGLVLEMIAEAIRSEAPAADSPPSWLDRARQYVEANFRGRLSLAEVAGAVGVHPFHLARQFRRHFRCTLGDCVRRMRVEFACRQLTAGNAPLVEIAFRSGFSHQSHFCRVFKQETGMTPSTFCHLSRKR